MLLETNNNIYSTVRAFNFSTAIGDKNRLLQTHSVDPEETAHHEQSYYDLRCLTFSLSTLHINFFPPDSLLTTNVGLKFSAKRARETGYTWYFFRHF